MLYLVTVLVLLPLILYNVWSSTLLLKVNPYFRRLLKAQVISPQRISRVYVSRIYKKLVAFLVSSCALLLLAAILASVTERHLCPILLTLIF